MASKPAATPASSAATTEKPANATPAAGRTGARKPANGNAAQARKPAAKAAPATAPAQPASSVPASKPAASKVAAPSVESKATDKKKPVKIKLVRDSYTIPEDEYALLAALKARALKHGTEIKKSELLRAGLQLLAVLDDIQLLEAAKRVERIKTGRPAKAK